jgi:hypothetical protein
VSLPGGELLDETTLRRALRFEADERPPLFDPAAIAAAVRPRPGLVVVSAVVALAIGGAGAAVIWSAVAVLLPTLAANAFDAGLGMFALVAVPASAVVEVAQHPAVPMSLLAALAIASAHELRERRLATAAAR